MGETPAPWLRHEAMNCSEKIKYEGAHLPPTPLEMLKTLTTKTETLGAPVDRIPGPNKAEKCGVD